MGNSLTIPISHGQLNLGTWQVNLRPAELLLTFSCFFLMFEGDLQGIWLNEHRNYGGSRSVCITIQGQKRQDGRFKILTNLLLASPFQFLYS